MTTTTLIAGLLGMSIGYFGTFMIVRRIIKREDNINEQKEDSIS